MVYYYVYIIKFEDGRFYIGSRQSKVPASKDVKYWGSPVTYKHLWEDASLSKTKHILKVCDSFEEMNELEPRLIKDAWKKYPDLCLNKNAAGSIHHDILCRELTKEEIKERVINGKKCFEQGLGIHSESFKLRKKDIGSKVGKTNYILGRGIFSLTPEEKFKRSSKGGKKSATENQKLGKGIYRPDLQHKRKEWAGIGGRANAKKNAKKFKFISPEGKVYEGINYRQWCRDMGFKPSGFQKIFNGYRETTHGGWRLG